MTHPTETNGTPGSTTDFRFTKRSRLSDGQAYGRVFKNAKRSRDKMFTVLFRAKSKTDVGNARLGMAISKKHCKLASGRNRIKRLVRESFRTHRADLANLDIVVLNQPAAASAANSIISNSLEGHWQQCKKSTTREAEKD